LGSDAAIAAIAAIAKNKSATLTLMSNKIKEKSMRDARDNHFHRYLLGGNLCSALFIFLVLVGMPSLSPRPDSAAMTGLIVAQTKDTLNIKQDKQAGDRIIMIFPLAPGSEGSGVTFGRDQATGDRIIHIVPPPAAVTQKKWQNVLIGPLFITPEITWPPQSATSGERP
jgi:hypothetical protein